MDDFMNMMRETAVKYILSYDCNFVIVMGQPDPTHYYVLCGTTPDVVTPKKMTAHEILINNEAHWSEDGMLDIRQMFEWGSYQGFFNDYPHETIVLTSMFKKAPLNITNWMTPGEFQNAVWCLSSRRDCNDSLENYF